MTTMKLQKLVYYSQAWNIAWEDDVLFPEEIQAWRDGPVCPELFNKHRSAFRVSSVRGGDPSKLTAKQKKNIKKVLSYYGDKSPQWLSELTHMEDPWNIARGNTPSGQPSKAVITPLMMARYYSAL